MPWNLVLGVNSDFYNGLMSQTMSIVDISASGSIMTKTYDEAYELMEKLALNHHQMMYDKTMRKVVLGIIQMDVYYAFIRTTLSTKQTNAKSGKQDSHQ